MRNYKRMWEALTDKAKFYYEEGSDYEAEYGYDLLEDITKIERAEDKGELKKYLTE